jgi:hypothetical protein
VIRPDADTDAIEESLLLQHTPLLLALPGVIVATNLYDSPVISSSFVVLKLILDTYTGLVTVTLVPPVPLPQSLLLLPVLPPLLLLLLPSSHVAYMVAVPAD